MQDSITCTRSGKITCDAPDMLVELGRAQGVLLIKALQEVRKTASRRRITSHSHSVLIYEGIMSVTVIAFYDRGAVSSDEIPIDRVLN